MEIPAKLAKNTIGPSIKSNFYFPYRHFSATIYPFPFFFFLSHKNHPKKFAVSQKSKFLTQLFIWRYPVTLKFAGSGELIISNKTIEKT